MVKSILTLALMVFMFWLFFRTSKEEGQEEEASRSESVTPEEIDRLETINELKEDIKLISDMIADIESCSPHTLMRTVVIYIPEKDREYQFIADGRNKCSDDLIDLLSNERERKSSSLRIKLKKFR